MRSLPRPGQRARDVAVKAAYGGGTSVGVAGLAYALLVTEAKLARKTIGPPTGAGQGPHEARPARKARTALRAPEVTWPPCVKPAAS